ncbi:hypothetical protein V3C33_01805 [Micrococcaceae bacterium Sec5.7]
MVSTDGQIAGINDQFVSMWGIPRELLATHDDEAVMGFVLSQLSDPAAFLEKVQELYANPLAEATMCWISPMAAPLNGIRVRRKWRIAWWAECGVSVTSPRAGSRRNRPSEPWLIWPSRQPS